MGAATAVAASLELAGGPSRVGSPPANAMVGAMGAFNALDEASRSGPSEGRADGGAEAAPESRLGFGGGASLREKGGEESWLPGGGADSLTPLGGSTRGAAS